MKKNEKGSVLVMVLVSMAALIILGTVLAGTGSTELLETARQEQKMQAFYLARSGAEAVASSIIKEPELAAKISSNGFSDPVNLGGGAFKAKVEPLGEEKLLITSNGKFKRAEETITLTLEKTNVSVEALFDRVIFSNSDLDISHNNAHAYGDVESRGSIKGKPEKGYKVFPNSERIYPSPIFPNISPNNNKREVKNKETFTIRSDCYYKNITVKSGGTLIVSTGLGQDIQVVVEEIELNGDLEIQGEGRLLLFVEKKATLQTPGASTTPVESLIVFMKDNSTATFIANSTFRGFLYGPKATVILQSAQTEIHGAVIADRVVKNQSSDDFQGTLYFHEEVQIDPDDLTSFISYTSFQRGVWD